MKPVIDRKYTPRTEFHVYTSLTKCVTSCFFFLVEMGGSRIFSPWLKSGGENTGDDLLSLTLLILCLSEGLLCSRDIIGWVKEKDV